MTGLVDRLKSLMATSGIKPGPLADTARVGRSFVYDILYGRSTSPSYDKLSRVAAVLGTTAEHLMTGEGSATGTVEVNRNPAFVTIPFIKVAAAMGGAVVVTDEDEGDALYFRRSWVQDSLKGRVADLRMLRVIGDSMEPTLLDGDVVMVHLRRASPTPPGIFVLNDGYGLLAKRLELIARSDPPRVRVISDNPRYPPYEMTSEEVRIIGRIVWFARRL